MRQAAVLALDIATTTGWALHFPGLERPYFGAFRLPGDARAVGQPADALERWMRDMCITMKARGGISHIFFEAQHISQKANIDTVYRLIALGGVVEKFAFQIKAHTYKVDISSWRKHFIGRGSGFKKTPDKKAYLPGEDPKELAVQTCADYGWHTDVADAAEAIGILDYALTMLPDYERPWRDRKILGGIA